MAGGRHVKRHKVRVGISQGVEIDRRFHTRPFCSRHRRVGKYQIIESQTTHAAIALQPSTQTSRVICSLIEKRVIRFRISREMVKPEASPSNVSFHPEI